MLNSGLCQREGFWVLGGEGLSQLLLSKAIRRDHIGAALKVTRIIELGRLSIVRGSGLGPRSGTRRPHLLAPSPSFGPVGNANPLFRGGGRLHGLSHESTRITWEELSGGPASRGI